ncbi:MAG: hypothetical protein J5965_12640 [Aeriscardovia sp.]|jgi:type I restriction enzyme S subunit|nr:hypothetical protein [Prevotella sp.]MBO5629909.1 hypothetical protein [Aeriscardovia sp.]MBQ7426221.1 hypothetical protein [Prevotella sp.]MBQ8991779.1 hypothetical protein [Prevotella sp.]MBR0263397.1 hypothetical protein [Prevotella sp.]
MRLVNLKPLCQASANIRLLLFTTKERENILRPNNCPKQKAISIRCILQYYKEIGYTDYMTVGGSGGHLSPSYFDRVPIPNFSQETETELKRLYYSETKIPIGLSIDNFEENDSMFNNEAGIYELDRSCKFLKEKLSVLFDNIMNSKHTPFEFY